MRMTILFLALLLSTSASADWNSFLQTPLGGYVRAGIQLSSSMERSRGSSGSGGIMKTKDQDDCLDELKKSQKSWEESEDVINAAYLLSSIGSYDIDKAGDNATVHNIGLEKGTKLRVNSWSSVSAPHMNSQCRKHWKVTDNFIVDDGEKKCRVVTLSMKASSYNVLYCEGSNHIQIDPSKSHLVEFKISNDITKCE